MSQEPYDPGLIKWSSKAKLDLYTPLSSTEIVCSCKKTKQNKAKQKNPKHPKKQPNKKPPQQTGQMFYRMPPAPHFLWFVLYIVYSGHALAGECHYVWQRNHNEKQPTCISIGDIISSAVTTYFWAALSPVRCYGFPAILPFRISFLVSPHLIRN